MANRTLALKKVKAYVQNPELIKEPSMAEMADLVVLVLSAVQQIEEAIKAGRLDGKTPIPDKDYLSLESAQKALNAKVREMVDKTDSTLSRASYELQERVQQAIENLRNGKDGIVTDAEIQRAAEVAYGMLQLPDFDALVTTHLTSNGEAIRNALELLAGDSRYKVEIADVQGLADALSQLSQIRSSGGIGKNQVYDFIRQAIADGTITTGSGSVSDDAYAGSWNGVTDVAPSKNAVYDKIEALVLGSGTGDVVGPASAEDNNIVTFDLTTGKLIQDGGYTVAEVLSTDNHTDGSTNKVYTATEKTKLGNIEASADVTDAGNVGAVNAAATSKGTPVDADSVPIVNSESANAIGRVTFTNLKAFLKTYFDSLYASALGGDDNYVTDAEKTKLANLSGTNTGDNAVNSNYSGLVTNATHTGDATGSGALTVVALNGTNLAALGTGVLKNTTATGVPFISKVAVTEPATGSTLTIADGQTLTVNGSATITNGTHSGTNTGDQTLPTRDSLGLDTDDSPQFAGINLGHASDTTITRSGAGQIAVEGVDVSMSGHTHSYLANLVEDTTPQLGGDLDTNGNDIVLAENDIVEYDAVLSADGKYTGIAIDGTAGAALAFGDVVYLAAADSRWELADASAVGTAGTVLVGICVLAAAGDGNATKVLLNGTIRADTAFPALTISAPVYISETAGDVTQTAPTTADAVVRVLGYAITADSLYFCPSPDHITHLGS